jgi:hypothetical protein
MRNGDVEDTAHGNRTSRFVSAIRMNELTKKNCSLIRLLSNSIQHFANWRLLLFFSFYWLCFSSATFIRPG